MAEKKSKKEKKEKKERKERRDRKRDREEEEEERARAERKVTPVATSLPGTLLISRSSCLLLFTRTALRHLWRYPVVCR